MGKMGEMGGEGGGLGEEVWNFFNIFFFFNKNQ